MKRAKIEHKSISAERAHVVNELTSGEGFKKFKALSPELKVLCCAWEYARESQIAHKVFKKSKPFFEELYIRNSWMIGLQQTSFLRTLGDHYLKHSKQGYLWLWMLFRVHKWPKPFFCFTPEDISNLTNLAKYGSRSEEAITDYSDAFESDISHLACYGLKDLDTKALKFFSVPDNLPRNIPWMEVVIKHLSLPSNVFLLRFDTANFTHGKIEEAFSKWLKDIRRGISSTNFLHPDIAFWRIPKRGRGSAEESIRALIAYKIHKNTKKYSATWDKLKELKIDRYTCPDEAVFTHAKSVQNAVEAARKRLSRDYSFPQ